MKIAEVKQAEASLKGFTVVGKVFWIGKVKERINSTNGEKFTTQSIGISDGENKETDRILVEFSNVTIGDDVKGKEVCAINCRINDWQGKRNLRASDFSFDVIPNEIPKEDPAHPTLPKTRVIKDEEPVKQAEPEKLSIWDLKDVKIIRQHCETDAVSLVVKYFKGTLEEAIAEVIKTSAILVESIYQGLEYPIKSEPEKKEQNKPEHVEKFEEEMQAATQENVNNWESEQ